MPLASGMVCFMHLGPLSTSVNWLTSSGYLLLGFKCGSI